MKLIHIKDIPPFICFFSIALLFALLLSVENNSANNKAIKKKQMNGDISLI